MKFLIPLLMAILGMAGGGAAALFLAPAADDAELIASPCGDVEADPHAAEAGSTEDDGHGATTSSTGSEYARLNNQFIVPVVSDGRMAAMIVMSLSVEVSVGNLEAVFAAEPKLRDVFLQSMFTHANLGGFDGTFTSASNMRSLRQSLRDAARSVMGEVVLDVLIIDIVRQDI